MSGPLFSHELGGISLSFVQTFPADFLSTMSIPAQLDLDEKFLEDCMVASIKQIANPYPLSPTETLLAATPFSFGKISLSDELNASRTTRLRDKYPAAYSDFFGCGTPCIFKSGPSWPVRKGPEAHGIIREARPIYDHPIQPIWLDIGAHIKQALESKDIKWTSIGPRAYANAGESKPFCPFILRIGVFPKTLLYDDAVAAAAVVKEILTEAGFPDIDVAFVESLVTRSVGPKLLPVNPLLDHIPELRKPFTPTLGLGIAPRKYPYYESTAGLYLRLSKDDDRIAVLTCAHVARPPPVYPNTGFTKDGQRREEIITLGTMAYDNAITAPMVAINNCVHQIEHWNCQLEELKEHVKEEDIKVFKTRLDFKVKMAMDEIKDANVLHGEVTKHFTTLEQRTIGFVLHSEKIEVSADSHGFTKDWALIELYRDKIDWTTFPGNKIFVGAKLPVWDYRNAMFPHPQDHKNYTYPHNSLLQVNGIVEDSEIHKPQYLDANGEKCLVVVKNGPATGTTIGRVNGLESFTCVYNKHGVAQTSIEIAVLRHAWPNKFSDAGDSGSIVLDREGRIVGILAGGEGPSEQTDTAYLTPYWWLDKQIKAKFPNCSLYEVVE